jgi:hypothetical protein
MNSTHSVSQSRLSDPQSDKSLHPAIQGEIRFGVVLHDMDMPRLKNPVDLIVHFLKFESLTADFESDSEKNEMMLMVLIEINNVMSKLIPLEDGVKHVTQILTKNNLGRFRDQFTKTTTRVKRLVQRFSFKLPKEQLWLQKKGKLFGGDLLRKCFLTGDAFGQVVEGKANSLVKPTLFKDQEVKVEYRESQGQSGKVLLKWLDAEEVRDCLWRVCFVHGSTHKATAIYMQDFESCRALAHNCIIKRVLSKDKGLFGKFLALKHVWKVCRAQAFYSNRFKGFFNQLDLNEKLNEDHHRLVQMMQEYVAQKLPHLSDSLREVEGVVSFVDRKYTEVGGNLRVEDSNRSDESTSALNAVSSHDSFPLAKASLIDPSLYSMPDKTIITAKMKGHKGHSHFETMAVPLKFDSKRVQESIGLFRTAFKQVPPSSTDRSDLTHVLLNNCMALLELSHMLLPNMLSKEGPETIEAAKERLVFEAEAVVEKGSFFSSSLGFVVQRTETFMLLDFANSFKVDLNSLKFVRLKLTQQSDKSVVFEDTVDLSSGLQSLRSPCSVPHQVQLAIGGQSVPAVLFFTLFLVPKNLETAHALFPPCLIPLTFDHFELMLRKSDNAIDYRTLLFTPEHLSKASPRNNDLFSHIYNAYPVRTALVTRHQTLYLKSLTTHAFDSFKQDLVDVIDCDVTRRQLLTDLRKQLQSGRLSPDSPPLHRLVLQSLDLLTVPQRFLINDLNFALLHLPLLNLTSRSSSYDFSKTTMALLDSQLDLCFDSQPDIPFSTRVLAKRLTFDLSLAFENNTVNKVKLGLSFNRLFVPLIVRLVQCNSAVLDYGQLRQLAAHQILSTLSLSTYSEENQKTYLDSLICYFKLAFKLFAPDKYDSFRGLSVDFEAQLAHMLSNSFASVLPAVNFNSLQDVKQVLLFVVMAKSDKLQVHSQLTSMGVLFASLFDVVFFLSLVIRNMEFIKASVEERSLGAVVEGLVRKETLDLKGILVSVLEVLDFLAENNFFSERFVLLRDMVLQDSSRRVSNVTRLFWCAKSVKMTQSKVAQIIREEIVDNPAVAAKAQMVFTPQRESRVVSQVGVAGQTDPQWPNTDIFFEVFSGIDQFDDDSDDKAVTDVVPQAEAVLIYLNNMDSLLCNSLYHEKHNATDLSSVVELTAEDLSVLVAKHSAASQIVRTELFQELSQLSRKDTVPLVRLILTLILAHNEEHQQAMANLVLLVKALSGLVVSDGQDKVLRQLLAFVSAELYLFSGLSQLDWFVHCKVDSLESSNRLTIRTATISLGKAVVDVSGLCRRHLNSLTHVSKTPSILFGKSFCSALGLVLDDLCNKTFVDKQLRGLDLVLHVGRGSKLECLKVPFVVEKSKNFRCLCKWNQPVAFDCGYSSEDSMNANSILHIYDQLAHTIEIGSVAFRLKITIVGKVFVLLMRKFDAVLEVKVRFVESAEGRLRTELVPWTLKSEEASHNLQFELKSVQEDMDYLTFFLPVGEFVRLAVARSFEKMAVSDLARFVRMNTECFRVTTKSDKEVSHDSHFYDLKEWDKTVGKDSPFVLNVLFVDRK